MALGSLMGLSLEVVGCCSARAFCTLFFGGSPWCSPSSTWRSNVMAVISPIGAVAGCCWIASLSCFVASRMQSAGVSCETAIALCWKRTVSEIRSAPVEARIPLNVR